MFIGKGRSSIQHKINCDDASIYNIESPPAIKNGKKKTNVNKKYGRRVGKHDKELANTSIVEMLCKMMRQQFAPETDLDVSHRNPLSFHYFIAVIREVAEKKI